jgi:hypothetical protein
MHFDQKLWDALTAPHAHRLTVIDCALTTLLASEDGPVGAHFLALRVAHPDVDEPFDLMFRLTPAMAELLEEKLQAQLNAY